MKRIPSYHMDAVLSGMLVCALVLHGARIMPVADYFVLIIAAFVGTIPVLWNAIQNVFKGEWASMDMLASVALVFSLWAQEWPSAIFIALMLAAARILGDVTRDRTEKSIRGLLKLRPTTAAIEVNGTLSTVPIAHVKVGDVVVADIGTRIPVDGIIISGMAAVDESSLTGESLPVDKSPGNRVMSSTLVQSGSLRIQTTHVGKDTTLERIVQMVESARSEKPISQTMGEKFGKLYLVSIFVGSALLLFISRNVLLVLSVVLVVCADDIAVAIPIAYLRAIRSAARHGVIVKGARHLEELGTLQTMVFDKTGTLTTGKLAVFGICAATPHHEEAVLNTAALAARRSTHPLSRAIIAHADMHHLAQEAPDSVEERGGKGIIAHRGKESVALGKKALFDELTIEIPEALATKAHAEADKGHSISYVALNNTIIGFVAASDEVRRNAAHALAELRELGVQKIIMLTGDNKRAAQAIARTLKVDEWHAELLPEDKVSILRELQSRGHVAMVGDGVNDAGALSIASVGIAMGGLGTEGTIESAQIVLMRDSLLAIPLAIRLARQTAKISIQDFWIWGITNATGLALVFIGVIGPGGAAAYNFLSDFLPLFNSARVGVPKHRHATVHRTT